MRVPHVSERVKEAPAQALRGMFAGIGQLLLVTDKLRSKKQAAEPPQPTGTAATEAPVAAATAPAAASAPAAEAEVPVTAEAPAAAPEPKATRARPKAETPAAKAKAPAAKAETPAAKAETPAAKAETPAVKAKAPAAKAKAPAAKTARDPGAAGNVRVLASEDTAATTAAITGLPLPNYDELSVASLRARLRNLSAAQVAELVAYEKANADRAEVVAMFERRIAKLEAEG